MGFPNLIMLSLGPGMILRQQVGVQWGTPTPAPVQLIVACLSGTTGA